MTASGVGPAWARGSSEASASVIPRAKRERVQVAEPGQCSALVSSPALASHVTSVAKALSAGLVSRFSASFFMKLQIRSSSCALSSRSLSLCPTGTSHLTASQHSSLPPVCFRS